MGLFFNILTAINDPKSSASVGELATVINGLQQTGSARVDPSAIQTILSTVGQYIRPAIQQQAASGSLSRDNILGQLSGGGMGSGSLSSIMNSQMQGQIAQAVAQKTGMSAATVEGMLPAIIPAVLGFLKMGEGLPGSGAANPVLGAFLDSDRDGDTDLGDVFKFATRFLNPPAKI